VTEAELEFHKEKTNFHLRIAEIIRENSRQASLIVVTLPLPKKGSLPPLLYMAWLDFISQNLPPFLFLRGNQDSVLTFYS
jgi:solute carrier family 12 sodium/potassium/chloride transporter 2